MQQNHASIGSRYSYWQPMYRALIALCMVLCAFSVRAEFTTCPKVIVQHLILKATDEVPQCRPVPKSVYWVAVQQQKRSSTLSLSQVYLFQLDMQQRLKQIDRVSIRHMPINTAVTSLVLGDELLRLGQQDYAVEIQQHVKQGQGNPMYHYVQSSIVLIKPKYLHVLLQNVERSRLSLTDLDAVGSVRRHAIQGEWVVANHKTMGLNDLVLQQVEAIQDQLSNSTGLTGSRQEEYRSYRRYRFDGKRYLLH